MARETSWSISRRLAGGRVPDGYRPLTLGEPRTMEDLVYDLQSLRWIQCDRYWVYRKLTEDHWFSATRRPGKPQRELHEDEGG